MPSDHPKRDWRLRVQDILDVIAKIETYTRGMTFERFRDDDLVVDAVTMNFAVLGEATAAIPAGIQAKYPAIAWVRMREMRNVMIHVYFKISRRIVWDTLQTDLPPLALQLRAMLDAEGSGSE